jgi:phosphopentomutase
MHLLQKTYIFVIESLGVGEAPDANFYNDKNTNTLMHVAEKAGGLSLPMFSRLGFGNLTHIKGVPRSDETMAYYGKSRQISDSKDNLSGHWEIAGLKFESLFHTNSADFFPQFVEKLERETGKKIIFNPAFKPEQLITRYYYDHITEKAFLLYYNEDTLTLTISAHPDVADEKELKEFSEKIKLIGHYYGFIRFRAYSINHTKDNKISRKEVYSYSIKPEQTTLLGSVKNAGIPVYFFGQNQNIFQDSEFSKIIKTTNDEDTMEKVTNFDRSGLHINESGQALLYIVLSDLNNNNIINKDSKIYSEKLISLDQFFQRFIRSMNNADIVFITSSNGNDPSVTGKTHTREYLPVIAYSRVLGIRSSGNIGVRRTLSDIAETISDVYGLQTRYGGDSFWNYMLSQF